MSDNPDRLANLAARETMLDTQLAAANAKLRLTPEASEYRSIYGDYAVIHREYVDLAMEGNAEALKRALFLQWYRVTEPSYLCGVSDLDPAAENKLLRFVDRLCESNRLDAELGWMLPYYYLIADYYFHDGGQYPALVAHCQAYPHQGRMAQPPGFVSGGRGQMGKYWQSIFKVSPVQEPDSDTSDFSPDEDQFRRVTEATKIGGVPAWIQNNETPHCPHCGKPMRFVAQIDAEPDGPLPADPSLWPNVKLFDFGDAGIGYVFVCPDDCSSEGAFLWQCG